MITLITSTPRLAPNIARAKGIPVARLFWLPQKKAAIRRPAGAKGNPRRNENQTRNNRQQHDRADGRLHGVNEADLFPNRIGRTVGKSGVDHEKE